MKRIGGGREVDRELVVVSGYYGFGNLGDRAIKEELVRELSTLVERRNVVVLSSDPSGSAATFGVNAVNRWRVLEVIDVLRRARLFISGGGGLYQDTTSLRSVAYYAGLAFLARLCGAPQVAYAQGVGPLRRATARWLTRGALRQAARISVRDPDSHALLRSWGLHARLAADAVWSLPALPLPDAIGVKLPAGKPTGSGQPPWFIGLSLRSTHCRSPEEVGRLVRALLDSTPADTVLVPVVCQADEDEPLLAAAGDLWSRAGRGVFIPDGSQLARPSQWATLLGRLDVIVGMRFHALLLGLKSAVPCVGLACDPKVRLLMEFYGQPCLDLMATSAADDEPRLVELIRATLANRAALSACAAAGAARAETLARQNLSILEEMLRPPGHPDFARSI